MAGEQQLWQDFWWEPGLADLEGIVRSAWEWQRKHPTGYRSGEQRPHGG